MKIMLPKGREHLIRSYFNVPVEFCYPQNVSEFNIVIKNFQRKNKIHQIIIIFLGKIINSTGLLLWTTSLVLLTDTAILVVF